MKSVALDTLGCKLNFAETSTLGRQFLERGYTVVEPHQPCDVYVLNTCSVTAHADRECRQLVRRALRRSPSAYVVVVGCYAQLQPQELASIEGVDLVLGARDKFHLFDHAGSFVKRSVSQVFVSCIDETLEFTDAFSADVGGRTRAFLKVQDGCDYGCAFCTIPMARGASRSQAVDQVIMQARYLAAEGYKEIVLTGVNVGDYGKNVGTNLLTLLKELERMEGIERIRVSSIEPNLLTREMIDFMLGSEKVCNHFHIPLQSGSNAILARMRRRYRVQEYDSLVHYIKDRDPEAGIGSDVIVGFPGETDELFEETHRFLADAPVSYLHVFTYSERKNTHAAASMESVPPHTRRRRNETLRMLGQKKKHAFSASMVGKTMPVLFEGEGRQQRYSGLTENYVRVECVSDAWLTNEIMNVVILNVGDDSCSGQVDIPCGKSHEFQMSGVVAFS